MRCQHMICHECEDEDSKDRIARTERVCAETLGRIRQEKALLRDDLAAARAQIEALTKEWDEARRLVVRYDHALVEIINLDDVEADWHNAERIASAALEVKP